MRLADCGLWVARISSADFGLRRLPAKTRIKWIADCDWAPRISIRLGFVSHMIHVMRIVYMT